MAASVDKCAEFVQNSQRENDTAQKISFYIKNLFSKCDRKCDQIRTTDLVTFTGEILNGKLHSLCSAI